MVHAGGRPRTSSPTPEECIELGKDFVEWATEETEEFRCLVSQWYAQKHWMTRKQWKNMILTPQFSPYYEIGISALARKAVDGTMKEGFGHRYIRYYDRDLKEHEDDDLRFKAELASQVTKQGTEEENRKLDQILDAMTNRQSSRKIDNKSIKAESKS